MRRSPSGRSRARRHNAGVCLMKRLTRRRTHEDQSCRQTAPGCGCRVVVQLQLGVGPFQLVWLVADREIEALEAKLDRVRHEFAQMKRARSVVCDFGIDIAREHVVVAIAENDAEVGRRAAIADLHAADVNQVPRFWIGREIEIELPVSRLGKDVGNSFARERSAFLIHQRFERTPGVVRIGRGREADVAELGHVPELGAVAAARRRRALLDVEFLPVIAQVRPMRAARIGRNLEDT